MICPYCNNEMEFMTANEFYGRKVSNTNVYVCRPCDARVGTHGRGKTPLGTPANSQLRSLRMMCHQHFDLLWKRGKYSRGGAYRWLQQQMDMTPEEAHIGMFTVDDCKKLLRIFGVRIR